MTPAIPARLFDRTTPPHIVTLVLLAGIGAMNMSVFLPSLPSMTTDFGTEYGVMQLAVSLYLAVTALLQLVIGPLADRFGRRPVMIGSLVIFICASVGCMLAQSVETFLAFRMTQAAVASGLALSRAVVRDLYEEGEAASMIGYVTMGMALVPMFAPTIGGALEELVGWRATFAFLTLAGLGVLALAWTDMGETRPDRPTGAAAAFRDLPELFASRRFWGYVAAAAFASGSFFAFLGGAPFVASEVYGLSAFWAGVGFGAPAIGYMLGNFLSGRYSAAVGVNRMIQFGTLITLAGLGIAVALTAAGFGSAQLFFLSCTSVGLGNGLVIPNSSAGMLSVRPHLAGTASGIGGAAMVGGGAALSAFSGVVLGFGGGSLPLLVLMLTTSVLAVLSITYVIRREAAIAG
ncbi:MAG: multidrug effflux MFS transporter [Pseudomonadota bacterium]